VNGRNPAAVDAEAFAALDAATAAEESSGAPRAAGDDEAERARIRAAYEARAADLDARLAAAAAAAGSRARFDESLRAQAVLRFDCEAYADLARTTRRVLECADCEARASVERWTRRASKSGMPHPSTTAVMPAARPSSRVQWR